MKIIMEENSPLYKIKENVNILQWNQLNISSIKGDRTILKDLTGEIKSGQSLAIMGSSGAGKTTFLNYLSGKNIMAGLKKNSGDVKFVVNGKDEIMSFKKLSGYVTQDDILHEVLTPRELLTFAAQMRLPGKTKKEKEDSVENLIRRLGLEKCADTKVGDVISKGLSGGERKRTAIGYELITDPYVLFLDEPTTGLDSKSASRVIKIMTEEARINNKIIIFTIHQPNSEIFNQFDQLMLLAEGKLMYYGNSKDTITYFSELGYSCPVKYNPAEYFIKIFSKENKIVEKLDLNKSWNSKKDGTKMKRENSNYSNGETNSKGMVDFANTVSNLEAKEDEIIKDNEEYEKLIDNFYLKFKDGIKITDFAFIQTNRKVFNIPRNNFFVQLSILFDRNLKLLLRNKMAFFVRLMMTISNSILVILIFNSLGKGNNAVQDRNGCMFFITTSVVQANLQTNLMIFTEEKVKFYKEQDNRMYGVVPYFISKTILEIPMQILLSLLVFCSTYFLAGLNTTDYNNFWIFIVIIFLAGYSGGTFAIFLSSLFDKRELVPAIFPFLLYTQIQASGYFASIKNFPYIFYPFKYISLFRYCYQALCWNEYKNLSPESLDCQIPVKCKFPTDDFPEDLLWSILALVYIAISFNILAVISLKIKVMLRKHK